MRKFNYHNVDLNMYSTIKEFWCSLNAGTVTKKLQFIEFEEIGFVEGRFRANDLKQWNNLRRTYKAKF